MVLVVDMRDPEIDDGQATDPVTHPMKEQSHNSLHVLEMLLLPLDSITLNEKKIIVLPAQAVLVLKKHPPMVPVAVLGTTAETVVSQIQMVVVRLPGK